MAAPTTKTLSKGKIILFSGIILLAFILIGEIGLRFLGYSPPETCFVNAAGVHHLHKSNYIGTYADMPIITNRWGQRDSDFPKEKPAGEVRIMCLGDSVTYGHGVNTGEDYPSQLELALNNRDSGSPHWQVINTGADAYSTFEEVEYYIRYGKAFNPDKVVIGICLNDVTETNLPLYVPGKDILRKSAYFYFIKDIRKSLILNEIKDHDKAIYGIRDDVTQASGSPETERAWNRVFTQLKRLKGEMGAREGDLSIIIFPVKSQLTNGLSGPQDRVKAFCATENIAFLDPLPILKNNGEMYVDELHFNPAGCRRVAEWLAGYFPKPQQR